MMRNKELYARIDELETVVEKLTATVQQLTAKLKKGNDFDTLFSKWMAEVNYAEKLQQSYLWELYRNAGESDEEMYSRFFHSLTLPEWDPIFSVRAANARLLQLLGRFLASHSLEWWLADESLVDALKYGGFSPGASWVQIGMMQTGWEQVAKEAANWGLQVQEGGGSRATATVSAAATSQPSHLITHAKLRIVKLEVFTYESNADWQKRHADVSIENLLPLKFIPCFDHEYPIPQNPAALISSFTERMKALPTTLENTAFSTLQESTVEALQKLSERFQEIIV